MEQPRPYSEWDLNRAKRAIDAGPRSGRDALQYAGELELQLNDFRDKRVLDLGAGSGLGLARGLAEIGVESEVYSFSPAFAEPGPAQEATGFVQDAASKRVVAGMGQELPYETGSFDLIVSLHVAEHLSSPEQLLKILNEAIRVLKPNGVIHLGPLPSVEPTHDVGRPFVPSKPVIQGLLADRKDIEVRWRDNKPPFGLIVVRGDRSRYAVQGCVLIISKS